MKKVLILATAALLFSGASFADGGGKKKHGKSCTGTCKKGSSCCKDKSKTTAKM